MVITPQISLLFASVVQLLWPAIAAGNSLVQSSKRKQAMRQKYRQIVAADDNACYNAVVRLFTSLCSVSHLPHMFVTKFTRLLFERMMVKHEHIPGEATQGNQQQRLTKDEEVVMRYVGGYVVFKLPRKVKTIPNLEAVTRNMTSGADKDTKLSYTKEWIGLQNRGRLCQINDLAFLFFVELELTVRATFPETAEGLRQVDLRVGTATAMLSSRKVLQLWENIVQDELDEHYSLKVLQLIVDFYIQIRGFSY